MSTGRTTPDIYTSSLQQINGGGGMRKRKEGRGGRGKVQFRTIPNPHSHNPSLTHPSLT